MICTTHIKDVIGFETSFYDPSVNKIITKAGKVDVSKDVLYEVKLKLIEYAKGKIIEKVLSS